MVNTMSFSDQSMITSSATTSPAKTLSDWLRHKKSDFNVELRVHGFVTTASELMANDSIEDAIHYYSMAIELSPNDWSLYTNRSLCFEILERFDQSLSDAQKAIELSDKSVAKEVEKTK